jgi:hypothetical protein
MRTGDFVRFLNGVETAMVATSSRSLIEVLDRIEKNLGLSEPEVASALGVTVGTVAC